ncbi:hypothetical protein DVH24_002940 [Malus domestica]|uniref:Peptidase S26 domain-containing protein n=1 Tax=Malus domestica TaxID=3750 RepID=A0A498KBL9_MALDO|nr:hypothetical protein DVH24_002940 [Malus domestica]
MEKRSKRSHGSVSNISKVHGFAPRHRRQPLLLYGPSMLPTLNISGMLLSEHVSGRIGMVGSGDLVLVWSPTDPRKIVTKRVLGMQGDKVTYFVDPKHSDR